MPQKTAQFRFYAELNDFLPEDKRQKDFEYRFWGTPSVKDSIEALGVPHTEVDMILLNEESVGFEQLIGDGDRVAVYPVFESINIKNSAKLRENPLRNPRFILDVHLGKLARLLRMTGFDTYYCNDIQDSSIVELALKEKRIILTRDLGLLKIKTVTHGYFVRSTEPWGQLKEVLARFDLKTEIEPFKRCLLCNGILKRVGKGEIKDSFKDKTLQYYDDFFRCSRCEKIYWKGSHYHRMNRLLNKLLG